MKNFIISLVNSKNYFMINYMVINNIEFIFNFYIKDYDISSLLRSISKFLYIFILLSGIYYLYFVKKLRNFYGLFLKLFFYLYFYYI